MSHPAETANRIAKAERLHAFIKTRDHQWTADAMEGLDSVQRDQVCKSAGEGRASIETWAMLVALMRAAEDVARIDDVFGGLS